MRAVVCTGRLCAGSGAPTERYWKAYTPRGTWEAYTPRGTWEVIPPQRLFLGGHPASKTAPGRLESPHNCSERLEGPHNCSGRLTTVKD